MPSSTPVNSKRIESWQRVEKACRYSKRTSNVIAVGCGLGAAVTLPVAVVDAGVTSTALAVTAAAFAMAGIVLEAAEDKAGRKVQKHGGQPHYHQHHHTHHQQQQGYNQSMVQQAYNQPLVQQAAFLHGQPQLGRAYAVLPLAHKQAGTSAKRSGW